MSLIIRRLRDGETAELNANKAVEDSKGWVDLTSDSRDVPKGLYHPPTGTLIVDKAMLSAVTMMEPAKPVATSTPPPALPPIPGR